MSNTTSALHLESAVASAFSIGVGCAGCVVLFVVALVLGGVYWHTRRASATFKVGRAATTVGRVALLAFLYLIVGTNQVTWERPSDGERNNLLRVALGLLVNLVWLDFLVCVALPKPASNVTYADSPELQTNNHLRNKLVRPAVRILVVVATMTVGASPTAREFALVLTTLVLLSVLIVPVALLRGPALRADGRLRIVAGGCAGAGGLLFLGELLSPSYVAVIGNGPALLFMLFGHLILVGVHAVATWLDIMVPSQRELATAPALSEPAGSGDLYTTTSPMVGEHGSDGGGFMD